MKQNDSPSAISCIKRCFFGLGLALAVAVGTPLTAVAGNSISTNAEQSKVKVTGKVLDEQGQAVIGATVQVMGTNDAKLTDVNGYFDISVPVGATLQISFMGYEPQQIQISQATNLDISLKTDAQSLDEVVVVGFATQKKENLTGAVASVNVSKALEGKPVADLSKGLQGVTPGLNISYGSGNLGSSAKINVRGTGTIINGVEKGSPLVLVDGIPTEMAMVNPEDVASISVLKDAASASIYGARAAFGVILITTKTGKKSDKVTFSYTGNFGWNNPGKLVDFLDPTVELPAMIEAQRRAGNDNAEAFGMQYKTLLPGVIKWQEQYANNRQGNNMVYGEDWEIIDNRAYFYRVWEPHDEMLGKNTPQMNHTLSAQGRMGEKSAFMVSLGYSDQTGPMKIKPEKMQRYNANINFNTELASWLKADFRVMASRQEFDSPYNYYSNSGYNRETENGYFGYYMRWGKFFPYGTYEDTYFRHAPGYMAQANYNKKRTDYMRINGVLTAQITKDINIIGEYSIGVTNESYKLNGGTVKLWDFWSVMPYTNETIGSAVPSTDLVATGSIHDRVAQTKSASQTQVFNAYANYTKTFGNDHNFKAMAGINTEWNNFERTYAERRQLLDRNKPEFALAVGDQFATSSWSGFTPGLSEYAIAGVFARVNYDYKGIWLLELNARYDGSSKFPTTEQFGFFPSASVGYRITEQKWMQGAKSWLNDAKIRASIGSIGNQNIKDNAFLSMMTNKNPNWIGGGSIIPPSVDMPNNVDPYLTWESVTTTDIGIDLRLFNMFNITADWYQRNTKGMLAPGKVLPDTFGQGAAETNAGNLRTRGWEIGLGFNKAIGERVSVYADLTLSDYQTVVTKWNNPSKTLGSMYEGQVLGEIWGLTTDRLYQAGEFETYYLATDLEHKNPKSRPIVGPDQANLTSGNFVFGPGDIKYVDRNGDGKITKGDGTVENPGDLSVIGNSTPRYQYGIRLGADIYGFDIEMFFQGVGQRDYWADSDLILPFYNRTDAMYGHMTDYWTPDNTDSYYPNPFPGSAGNILASGTKGSNNFITQTRYMLNMSYLRFKNLTVGYSLPKSVLSKIKLQKVRVYFSAQNLGEITNGRLPVDPEINETEAAWGRTFPYSRTMSFGLQLTF